MRRKLIVLSVGMLAVLLLATSGLVAAKGGHGGGGHGHTYFNITGTITKLDYEATTISLGDLTVYTTDDTRFRQCDEEGDSEGISFTDLVVGKDVRIKGVVDDGTYFASVVIQYVPAED